MTKTRTADKIRLESLPCSAACLTRGCTLAAVNSISHGRCEFILKGAGADKIAADFLMGRLEGNLLDFMRHFDDLRTAVRQIGGAR